MARGIRASGDVLTRTIDGVDTSTLWSDFSAAVAAVNGDRDSLIALLTYKTTVSGEAVLQAYGGGDFEDASEYGVPVSHRPDTGYVTLGYPLRWRDYALRSTWKYLVDASAEQIRADQDAGLEADNRQCFNAVMASGFDPTPRLNENGVAVVGFWNGDGVVPPAFGGQEFTGAETHYVTTGSTSLDNEDLAVLIRKPLGKGYGADGRGRLLVFAHPDQMPAIRRFRATIPADVIERILAEREHGATYAAIAAGLDADAIPTPGGGPHWHASTIRRLCDAEREAVA